MTSTLPQLKRRLKRARITQEHVASAAGVTRTMVNKVINGKAKSRKVVYAVERLLMETS